MLGEQRRQPEMETLDSKANNQICVDAFRPCNKHLRHFMTFFSILLFKTSRPSITSGPQLKYKPLDLPGLRLGSLTVLQDFIIDGKVTNNFQFF